MQCPNCERQNPEDAVECAFCSVIFAKFTARKQRTNPEIQPEDFTSPGEAPAATSSSANIVWLIVGLAVLAAGGWYMHRQKLNREAKARAKAIVEETIQRSRGTAATPAPRRGIRESIVGSARSLAGATGKARKAANAMSAAGEESKKEAERGLGLNQP